jgi:hypothetical protein
MTDRRKHTLAELNPRWISRRYSGADSDAITGIHFDCPEGHAGCDHAIPFTPALDGAPGESWQANGAVWQRTGDTFETLTLSPSIRRVPSFHDWEATLPAGCGLEDLTEALTCAFHGFIRGGRVEFCGDSR